MRRMSFSSCWASPATASPPSRGVPGRGSPPLRSAWSFASSSRGPSRPAPRRAPSPRRAASRCPRPPAARPRRAAGPPTRAAARCAALSSAPAPSARPVSTTSSTFLRSAAHRLELLLERLRLLPEPARLRHLRLGAVRLAGLHELLALAFGGIARGLQLDDARLQHRELGTHLRLLAGTVLGRLRRLAVLLREHLGTDRPRLREELRALGLVTLLEVRAAVLLELVGDGEGILALPVASGPGERGGDETRRGRRRPASRRT